MTDPFTLLSQIGRGAMGVVWRARNTRTGAIVAIKLLAPAYAHDPDYRRRFARELELARRVNSPNVVKVLGFGVREGTPYIALEYVEGRSLRDIIASHGPYSWPEARGLLVQITRGLVAVHGEGILHRDLKPANILVGADGVAKLTDFGIAAGLDLTRVTGTSTMLGTPTYLAPEGHRDVRSDLYGLGVVAYEMLAGAPPFIGTTHQDVILAHVRTPPDLGKLPPEARPLIGALLAKDPGRRPASAEAVLTALEAEPGAGKTVAGTSSRRRLGVLAAATIITATALVAVTSGLLASRQSGGGSPSPIANQSASPVASGHAAVSPSADARASASPVTPCSALTTPPPAGHERWVETGTMIQARAGPTATLLCNGLVLVAGGLDETNADDPAISSAELYHPDTGRWTTTGTMTVGRFRHTATLLSDGRVLVVGGLSSSDAALASAETYDPTTGKWTATGSMALARSDHTATKLPDGSVLVAGGQIDDGGQPRSLASAERYDPATGRWTPAGDMTVARSFATATLLRDGTVLVVGGDRDFGEGLASAEIYDPRTGEWTAAGDMSQARSAHAASLLGNGRVLVVGWGSRAAEVYNPLSRTWSATGSLNDDPGMEPVATVLTNGEVLVVGWNETETNGAQRFDPIAGTWARTPAIPSVPFDAGATAVRLSDGAVLVVGGSYGRSGPTDTVLLYMPETAH